MAEWIADAVLVAVLLAAAISDLRRGRIGNWLTYPAMLAGLAIWAIGGYFSGGPQGPGGWAGAWGGLKWSLLGWAVGFGPMLLAFKLGGIGGGDAKLSGAVGALARPKMMVLAMFYGFLVGGAIAVAVMIRRRVVKRTMGRIWRFVWLLTLPGPAAKPASPSDSASPRVPFGLALCIGAIWAIVEKRCFNGRAVLDWLVGR